MGPIVIMIIVLFIIASSGAFGSRVLFQGYSNLSPGKAKIEADFREIRDEIAGNKVKLVPWNEEERKLLSLKVKPYKEKSGMIDKASGTMLSIYAEPMVLFSYKRYVGKKRNAILAVITPNHEFLYRIHKGKIEVAFNKTYLGAITPDLKLLNEKKQVIAQLIRTESSPNYPIYIGGREKGRVVNKKKTKKINPRAFEFLTNLSAQDEPYFLALAFYLMIHKNFRKIK